MNKIIIEFEETVPADVALAKVQSVVRMGKISEAAGVPHYCWHTSFIDGVGVGTRRKKKGQNSDSFIVRKEKENGS